MKQDTTVDIHDQLIARLEEVRRAMTLWTQPHSVHAAVMTSIDMALYAVRAKCSNCGDRGYCDHLDETKTGTVRVFCYCNRPALLAEWERKLNGGT